MAVRGAERTGRDGVRTARVPYGRSGATYGRMARDDGRNGARDDAQPTGRPGVPYGRSRGDGKSISKRTAGQGKRIDRPTMIPAVTATESTG